MDNTARTAGALLLGVFAAIFVAMPSSEYHGLVLPLLGAAMVLLTAGLFLGSSLIVAAASLPFLGAALALPIASDDPAWVSSLLIGCLWYLTLEASWDTLERRDGTRVSTAAGLRRLSEVGTVVGVALIMGLFGLAASTAAPARTFVIQFLVVASFFGAAVAVVEHLSKTSDRKNPTHRP